jgi:hypothetical protein
LRFKAEFIPAEKNLAQISISLCRYLFWKNTKGLLDEAVLSTNNIYTFM